MNKDFVPLSSLLEQMKKTSFEEVSSDAVNSPVDGMSQVADENQGSLPNQTPDQKKPAPISPVEPEKKCNEPKFYLIAKAIKYVEYASCVPAARALF